ncbi:MAG: hypothetical protein ACRCTS_01715 [Fusobacteriaceae bacterium]
MRDTYLGLNQANVVELQQKYIDGKGKSRIEIEDLILLRRIGDFIFTSKGVSVVIDTEVYHWINYGEVQKDLPMIFSSMKSLKKRIEKLKTIGLIINKAHRVTKEICSEGGFDTPGSYSVIKFSEEVKNIFEMPKKNAKEIEELSHEGVKGKPYDRVKGKPHDGVRGYPLEGVKGYTHEGVKGKPHEGVTHDPMKGLTKNTMKEYHEREYPFLTDSQSEDQESNPIPVRKITQVEPIPRRKFAEEAALDNPVVKFLNKLMEQELNFTNSEKMKIIGYCEQLGLNPMENHVKSQYLQGNTGLKLTKRMFLRYDTWEKMKLGDYNDKEGIQHGRHQGTNGIGDEEAREIARQKSVEKWGF